MLTALNVNQSQLTTIFNNTNCTSPNHLYLYVRYMGASFTLISSTYGCLSSGLELLLLTDAIYLAVYLIYQKRWPRAMSSILYIVLSKKKACAEDVNRSHSDKRLFCNITHCLGTLSRDSAIIPMPLGCEHHLAKGARKPVPGR